MVDARPRDDRERLAELAQHVVREPHSIPFRLDLAMALLAAGRRDDAINLFRDIALTYAEDGQLIQAMAVCRGILELDPAHEETLELLARFVERRGARPAPLITSGDDEVDDATMSEPDEAPADDSAVGADGGEPRSDEQLDTEHDLATLPDPDHEEEPEEPTSPGDRPAGLADLDGADLPLAGDDPVADALLSSAALPHAGAADLPAFPLLSALPHGAFLSLLHEIKVVEREAAEVVLLEGTIGDAFYLIAEGTVRVKKGSVELALLGPGAFFGEFALLSDQRRHATVETVTPVKLLEVTRELLDRLIAEHPGVANSLRAFYGERLLATLVQTAPLFSALSPEERAEVVTRFRPRRFGRGACIIEEGAEGGGLYLILVGEVEVVRSDAAGAVELGRLGEGSYFGEMSLLRGAMASATVRATRLCETVQLPPRDFYEIVSRHPVLWEQLRIEAQRRELTNVAILAGEARGDHDDGVYLI